MTDAVLTIIDWGSTNARAFCVDGAGSVIARSASFDGAASLSGGEWFEAYRGLTTGFPAAANVLVAGMAGRRGGWREAAYVHVPAASEAIAANITVFEENGQTIRIIPGVAQRPDAGRFNVMRGEETQVLGALEGGSVDGLLCLPGTHTKWVEVRDGQLASFSTSMTGEARANLRASGLIAAVVGTADGAIDADFDAGLDRGFEGDLLRALFELRAEALLSGTSPERLAARMDGLMIADDVRMAGPLMGTGVRVVGAGALTERYLRAFGRIGVPAEAIDGEAATLKGALRIARLAGLMAT
jgi:2-dehydro-3-deoxygalactonokinase